MFRELKGSLVAILLGVSLASSVWAKELPKARSARELKEYADILIFKGTEDPIFVKEDDGLKLVFGSFADDDNPQDAKAWNIYDVLYEDVPVLYESALSLMAKGEWAEALKLLDRCAGENTQVSKKKFSSTDIYANYVPHKYFLCHLNLGEADKALEFSEKIQSNKMAHSRVRVMLMAIPLLIEREKAADIDKIVTELEALSLPRRDKMELALSKCLALSLNKKFKEAKASLQLVLDEYGADYSELAARVEDIQTTILVYHEKNYTQAVKVFEEILKKSREKASPDMYVKLAFCYSKLNKWEEARWNYLQAYLMGTFSKPKLLDLIAKIEETHTHIQPQEANVALGEFLEKVKKAL
jgi:hypothetical protein